MLFFVWLKFNDIKNELVLRNITFPIFSLRRKGSHLKILGIPPYVHLATTMWLLNIDVDQMAVSSVDYWRDSV